MTMVRINTSSPMFWLVTAIASSVGYITLMVTDSYVGGIFAAIVAFVLMTAMHYKGHRDAFNAHIGACEEHSKRMVQLVSGEKPAAASITKAEQNVVDNLLQAIDDFEALGEEHDGEHEHFNDIMHTAIAMVFARVGMRSSLAFKVSEEMKQ